jgi:multidrug resistance efflux pump
MKKNISIILILGLLAVFVSACGGSAETAPIAVEPDYLIAEGSLLPVKALDHSFTISGQIAEINVASGDRVGKGQIMASIQDSAELNAVLAAAEKEALAARQALDDYVASADENLAQAQIEAILARKRRTTALNNYNASKSTESQARLDEATGEMERLQALYERIEANDGLDPDQMNTLEAQVASADANVASAQEALDALNLQAAMSGVVSDLNLEVGQRVSAGEVVLALADFSQWIIETDSLTEIEVVNVSLGQPVEVVLDALPDAVLKGHVTNINERFEEKRGDVTYAVTVELEETDPLMRWGMTAAVYFLPESAEQATEGQD